MPRPQDGSYEYFGISQCMIECVLWVQYRPECEFWWYFGQIVWSLFPHMILPVNEKDTMYLSTLFLIIPRPWFRPYLSGNIQQRPPGFVLGTDFSFHTQNYYIFYRLDSIHKIYMSESMYYVVLTQAELKH